ncbi:ROK family protein [Furfurilactobacillus milii]|nr:ROK family protein [Furfurilactobacillus milii]MCF6160333.1 ROK family protein [Furfurilactobacillus milii]MCF6162276.1 ROK family protein [Furfurilactobacillus milii]QLE65756.1 xylose operon regulator [Furfurilactobacillus rossiae]QLE68186.1 xylose operon regulator [Furfurilactobacillus rossiae]
MIINKHIMRSTNEKQVLQQIINEGPISRSQISRNLELNKETVSDIYNQLLKSGVIREVGHGVSTKNGGRRPVMGELNVSKNYVMAINLGSSSVDILISRFNASKLSAQTIDTEGINLTTVMDMITAAIAKAVGQLSDESLAGIAFVIDGTVYNNHIINTELKGLENFDLAKYFADKFQVPVLIENAANLSAIYERDFHDNELFKNLVTLMIGKHLRAGIVADQHLYTGHEGHAVEVGEAYLVDRYDHSKMAAADVYASEPALNKAIRERMGWQEMDFAKLTEAYYHKDERVMEPIDDFAYYLSRVLTNLSTSFAPDVVILNGDMFKRFPQILQSVRNSLVQMMPDGDTPVILTKGYTESALLGATSYIIHHALGLDDLKLDFQAKAESVAE